MNAPVPRGNQAVMASRHEPPDSLDFFPTPPWATRALLYDVLVPRGLVKRFHTVWDPACGEGHMVFPLAEHFLRVYASDVFDYRKGFSTIGSFVGQGPDVVEDIPCNWVVTNPPFNLAVEFAERALNVCSTGVALLVRSAWAEGRNRYERLFRNQPPSYIAQFCDRVAMVRGRYDPNASTATAYAWFVWEKEKDCGALIDPKFIWIAPGARVLHEKPHDIRATL